MNLTPMQLIGAALATSAAFAFLGLIVYGLSLAGQARRAIVATLRYYPQLDSPVARRRLRSSRDGLAIALLLLNRAAKVMPQLYKHKVPLLRALVARSGRNDWWGQERTHREASTYTDTFAIFVETTIGPILDLPRVQISAHVSRADFNRFFPTPRRPTAAGGQASRFRSVRPSWPAPTSPGSEGAVYGHRPRHH